MDSLIVIVRTFNQEVVVARTISINRKCDAIGERRRSDRSDARKSECEFIGIQARDGKILHFQGRERIADFATVGAKAGCNGTDFNRSAGRNDSQRRVDGRDHGCRNVCMVDRRGCERRRVDDSFVGAGLHRLNAIASSCIGGDGASDPRLDVGDNYRRTRNRGAGGVDDRAGNRAVCTLCAGCQSYAEREHHQQAQHSSE